MSLKVHSLNVFPVKSLRGIALETATLTPKGMDHDRQWMVVGARGWFLTQRNIPKMAQVITGLEDGELILDHDEHSPCRIALQATSETVLTTEVWGDRCEVLDVGNAAARWLQKVLETRDRPRLVRMAPGYQRPQRHPERFAADTRMEFADSSPYLVTNLASLEALNDSLQREGVESVPMNRFRANIVLEGLPPFEEQVGGTLSGPGYTLRLSYPCERCVVTTTDQITGERNAQKQPFRLLQRINPMPGDKKGPAFGMQAILETGENKVIRVGDELRLEP